MTAPDDLKPREIAVLVALRRGPLNDYQLRDRISDDFIAETVTLTSGMCSDDLIGKRAGSGYWRIAPKGLSWLVYHGMGADPNARLESTP